MSAPVPDTVWTSGDANNPPPAADTAQHGSVAIEPLERVGTAKELNDEKVLDREYVQQKESEKHDAEKHGHSALDRHQSDWTSASSSNETPDD
ncbi:hypothetical protein KCU69_g10353, partial [Aureobasidium melanogenum]